MSGYLVNAVLTGLLIGTVLLAADAGAEQKKAPYEPAELLYADGFTDGLRNWVIEGESPEVRAGAMAIDTGEGFTAWFRERLSGDVLIEYQVRVIDAGGPNDRVSDLNCFWMATDPKSPDDLFAGSKQRAGIFANYDPLRLYYVGYGGNSNKTTRFRRYPGGGERPVLGEYTDKKHLIEANKLCTIQLVVFGDLVQYIFNGDVLFELKDPEPLTSGWFGIRTVKNHMNVYNFKVYRLKSSQ
jgi:hypothetical protein